MEIYYSDKWAAPFSLIQVHQTDASQIGRLLDVASRCLDDARQESITLETRLEAGYRSIMQLGMLALWANGYRLTTASA